MNTAKFTKRLGLLLVTAGLGVAVLAPGGAQASFSCFEDATVDPAPGSEPGFGVAPGCFDGLAARHPGDALAATKAFTQAAGHPFDLTTKFNLNTRLGEDVAFGMGFPIPWPEEAVKDAIADTPAGLLGNPTAVEQCTMADLAITLSSSPNCKAEAQVGSITLRSPVPEAFGGEPGGFLGDSAPLYNIVPPPGVAARFGFNAARVVITIDAKLRSGGDYGLSVASSNITEALPLLGIDLTFWGTPGDPSHDPQRWCAAAAEPGCQFAGKVEPFLSLPTACTAPGVGLQTTLRTDSWFDPGDFKAAAYTSHDPPFYPDPGAPGPESGIDGCANVPVRGSLEAKPTSIDAQTPSGLEAHVEVPGARLDNGSILVQPSSDLKAVKVTLPEGVTVNPSQAEGLGTCAPAQYASTELSFFPTPGKGCPTDSKIGTVSVETPLLEETIPGDVFIAEPHNNPFDSLLALYVVLKEPQRGILVKLAGKVETNESTGQIVTTFEDLPQLPFSTFDFRFREGARAPLVTPPACGTYETVAEFTGHSAPNNPITRTSSFQITRGIGGGPCPTGGIPPFKPGLIAGSRNNNAGSYSPFDLRLFRSDSEQQFTNFSIKLPPGITGKLAGIPFCPDASIAAAKGRTGAAELASPSCPEASYVGRTLVGAGVGSVQTYVPGRIYLAGPYNGSALSIAAITAAKVGPFDLGTVVLRLALRVDPETAEVFVDPTGSDPIPHIIKGIPTKLRDIRAYVERPDFVLNPTSCDPTSTASTVLGSGLDFASPHDDQPVTVSTRFQAANCASLPFKPALALSLKGGTKRGGHPKLKAVLRMRPGMANIARAQVTLPKSAFLDQSHIGAVCTRVQYAADQCPPKSVYGYARAFTPLLDEPIEGPVYLRSSSHKLPDLVAGLKSGRIELDVVGRIDSLKGRIRSTFETVPDAPVSKFVLTMQGGKKGLLENSADLCKGAQRAIAAFDGHNGKVWDFRPLMRPDCGGKRKGKRR